MHMTFEKIDDKPEHPAARAAKMVKDLHQQNLDMIDSGFVFMKDGENVNDEMRRSCKEQIKNCDAIIARADEMPPDLTIQAAELLDELTSIMRKPVANDVTIPEVGNYEHKETD